MAEPFHFPPDLLEQLVETIPRLIRSKMGVLDFFRSAGVPESMTQDLRLTVQTNSAATNKFKLARVVLIRLNDGGDGSLRQRREVVKRVVEWEDFSTCWEGDRLEAKGLVAEIQRVVSVKDSFTRMSQERQREARKNQERYEEDAAEKRRKEAELAALRERLAQCFTMTNSQKRGTTLEAILNDYFKEEGVAVREAFHVAGPHGEGVVEQIDGAIEIDARLLMVEMKWWSKPLGSEEVGSFLVKVFTRGGCGGLLIAHPGVTGPVVSHFRDAIIKGSPTFIVTVEQIYRVLDEQTSLRDYLRGRMQEALMDKRPA